MIKLKRIYITYQSDRISYRIHRIKYRNVEQFLTKCTSYISYISYTTYRSSSVLYVWHLIVDKITWKCTNTIYSRLICDIYIYHIHHTSHRIYRTRHINSSPHRTCHIECIVYDIASIFCIIYTQYYISYPTYRFVYRLCYIAYPIYTNYTICHIFTHLFIHFNWLV